MTALVCGGVTAVLLGVYVLRGVTFLMRRLGWDARRRRLFTGHLLELVVLAVYFAVWAYGSYLRSRPQISCST